MYCNYNELQAELTVELDKKTLSTLYNFTLLHGKMQGPLGVKGKSVS